MSQKSLAEMQEELLATWKPDPTVVDRCPVTVVDGHLEYECPCENDQAELQQLLKRDVIIRVRSKIEPEIQES